MFDPVAHKFYQLGRIEFLVLSHWAENSLHRLKPVLEREGLTASDGEAAFNDVIRFAMQHNLVLHPSGDTASAFTQQRKSMKRSWWRWMVENYLFVRIPLIKPGRFLAETRHRVEFLYTPVSALFFIMLALSGLLLVARQWDSFVASFLYFFNPQGLVAYGIGLVCVKVLHELGHAYTATRYGCRVPAMGVAFLVMMPVLYTDTTGAWRIRSRRKRLLVDCAGMLTELMVASIATMVWVFLPDGPVRSVAFVLATTSWAMSLLVNINPFMRFDGYYVLSDAANMPNLQPRAFALAKWKLREWLFALGEQAPEHLPARTAAWMIVYAYLTWIYRLILFIGIALLVYHMFFKALGIILFVVEIGAFIARPIFMELREWANMKSRIAASSRARKVGALLLGILVLLFLPIDRHVDAPAVMDSALNQPIVAGDPALLEEVLVRNGQTVREGQSLFRLRAPNIEQEIAAANVRLSQLRLQEGRATADAEDRANLQVLSTQRRSVEAEIAGLEKQRDGLVLRASKAGRVTDIPIGLQPGVWVAGDAELARLVDPARFDVQGFVDETELWRLEVGSSARFVPDDPTRPSVALRLNEIATVASEALEQPVLASSQGGPIAVHDRTDTDNDTFKPRAPIYRVALSPTSTESAAPVSSLMSGRVIIRARSTNLASDFADHVISVLRTVF